MGPKIAFIPGVGGVCEPQKQVEAKIQNETEKIYRLKHVRRRP